jgi:hypothetical protein
MRETDLAPNRPPAQTPASQHDDLALKHPLANGRRRDASIGLAWHQMNLPISIGVAGRNRLPARDDGITAIASQRPRPPKAPPYPGNRSPLKC